MRCNKIFRKCPFVSVFWIVLNLKNEETIYQLEEVDSKVDIKFPCMFSLLWFWLYRPFWHHLKKLLSSSKHLFWVSFPISDIKPPNRRISFWNIGTPFCDNWSVISRLFNQLKIKTTGMSRLEIPKIFQFQRDYFRRVYQRISWTIIIYFFRYFQINE